MSSPCTEQMSVLYPDNVRMAVNERLGGGVALAK